MGNSNFKMKRGLLNGFLNVKFSSVPVFNNHELLLNLNENTSSICGSEDLTNVFRVRQSYVTLCNVSQ